MLVIQYNDRGQAVSDFEVEEFVVARLLSSRNHEVEVSTENVVLMARVLIAERIVRPDQVRVSWNGLDMYFDEDGRFMNWNDRFSGVFDRSIDRLLQARRRSNRTRRG